MTLEEEMRSLINRRSLENASNTPDFILAEYLLDCLSAWNKAVQHREKWYGRDARPQKITLIGADPGGDDKSVSWNPPVSVTPTKPL